MPMEIFYYRDGDGNCPVQVFLDRLRPKEMARCLAEIDLLEGDSLPADMDKPARLLSGTDRNDDGIAADTDLPPLRVLSSRTGRERFRFSYMKLQGQTVILDATQGKASKSQRRAERDAVAEMTGLRSLPPERLKSHREFVAEITLSDPTLAALYSRAREHAQFAVAMIRLRDAAGFTADSLAERTGLSRARIESLERGRMPKLSTMRRLVDALQARIVIAPGAGVTIEPYAETPARRPGRPRKATAGAPSLTISETS